MNVPERPVSLIDSLSRQAPNKVFSAILLGALAGAAYALLIPLVLNAIASNDTSEVGSATVWGVEIANWRFAALFFGTCVVILFSRFSSQAGLLEVTMELAKELRTMVYRRISRAPIQAIEHVGQSRLFTTLYADIGRIVAGARVLPDLLISTVTLVGMLGFLLYMNASVFWFVMGAIVFGIVTYQIPMYFGNRYFVRARNIADELHESVRGLLSGAKELKLDWRKREAFFERLLLDQEAAILKLERRASTIVRVAMNYGDLISFFVIGATTFVFVNYRTVTQSELIGVIMALLYVTGPVSLILNALPQLVMARVSLKKLNAILADLPEEAVAERPDEPVTWNTIRFEDVCFSHRAHGDSAGFQVGPLSFEIRRGQITFIVGGNGSGKSTLSKLVTLHYIPQSGTIRFDDTVVDASSVTACRQEISAIYSDYYLFDRLLGVELDEKSTRLIDEYLVALKLDRKVSVENGKFSTLALSDGQRRRLALLVAFLEDKNLYLFDEWAADQDVMFKEVFYTRLLPDLKARDKAVVVISHDDRYFWAADQVVTMENGKLGAASADPGTAPPTARLSAVHTVAVKP